MHTDKKPSFLAVIPARAGSKRVPKKNIRPLHGKPLISWAIDAAMQSRFIDKIAVTSDDSEVLRIAGNKGEKVIPIDRPEHLAGDMAKTPDAILHAMDSLPEAYDAVVLLQPTCPFRTAHQIDEAIAQYIENRADGIISVTKAAVSPLWSNILPSNGDMSNFLNRDLLTVRSQDLPIYHSLNGAIFIANTSKFREQGNFFLPANVFAYEMPDDSSLDIDTEEDFSYAEFLCARKMGELA